MNITVKKRDGSREPFNSEKVKQVVQAAGLTDEKASELSKQIDDWLRDQDGKIISSLDIRDKVLEKLKIFHKPAADLFSWYQKTKE